MQRYEDREVEVKTVTRRECVQFECDLCKRHAENLRGDPEVGMFEYGGVGSAGGLLSSFWWIDGDCDHDELDLCNDCADGLMSLIRKDSVGVLEVIERGWISD